MSSKLVERLLEIQKETQQLDDENPAQLSRKIVLNCEELGIIGRLHAASVFDYRKAYAERKNAHALILSGATGTVAEKEAQAEMGSYQARINEAQAEEEMTRWENAKEAKLQLIQALKKNLDMLRAEYESKGA